MVVVEELRVLDDGDLKAAGGTATSRAAADGVAGGGRGASLVARASREGVELVTGASRILLASLAWGSAARGRHNVRRGLMQYRFMQLNIDKSRFHPWSCHAHRRQTFNLLIKP